MRPGKTILTTFSTPKELIEKIDRLPISYKRSRSVIVRWALSEFIEKYGNKKENIRGEK